MDSGAAPSSSLLADSLFLVALRGVFFLLARRLLLATLDPTLRHLSKYDLILPSTTARSPALTPVETDDDLASSYPASPTQTPPTHTPRELFVRRDNDESLLHPSALPSVPRAGGGIELEDLGRKLKDAGTAAGRKVQVLRLAHGTKEVTKATKGLGRLSK